MTVGIARQGFEFLKPFSGCLTENNYLPGKQLVIPENTRNDKISAEGRDNVSEGSRPGG